MVSDQVSPASSPPAGATPIKGMLKPSPFLAGFDLLLAFGTVALGCAIALFAVRNSDFWFHVGVGRLIAEGSYSFTHAPFTYSGTDRLWVNHAWLFDRLLFSVYTGLGEKSVVLGKGILIGMLTVILLAIRTPRQSLWIGVFTIGLTLVAIAPWLTLRPSILSMFYLGLTLFLLTRTPPRTWRFPAAIAVLFWLWSNSDQWFFLGPLIVAIYALGTFIGTKLSKADNVNASPSMRFLLAALAAGIVACTLNPHHFRVWTLPAELVDRQLALTLSGDPHFAPLFASLSDKGVLDFDGSSGGNPVNAIAFLLLLLCNVLGFALNWGRFSWSLFLINVSLLALAFVHAQALPFYAIAAGPVTALHLDMVVSRLRERTWGRVALQSLAAARVGIRMALFVAGLLALMACYPGWLHPLESERRLSLHIEPDPALVSAASQLQNWRDDGHIPAEAHSLILSTDLANYCAWFAPSESTYFDSRIGFHAPEAETFMKLHARFIRKSAATRLVDFDDVGFIQQHGVSHIVLSDTDRQVNLFSFVSLLRSAPLRSDLWAVRDRVSIFGCRAQKVLSREQYQALRFDTIKQAFGPKVEHLADAPTMLPPPPRTSIEKYLTPLPKAPAGADEAMLFVEYHANQAFNYLRARALISGGLGGVFAFVAPAGDRLGTPRMRATAILVARAARRAILESPNHPDGYLALALAYEDRDLAVLSDSLRRLMIIANLERYLARTTAAYCLAHQSTVFQAAADLAEFHSPRDPQTQKMQQMGFGHQIDLSLETIKKQQNHLKIALPDGMQFDVWQTAIKNIDKRIQQREQEVRAQENLWFNNASRLTRHDERARLARQYGLIRKALDELEQVDLGDENVPLSEKVQTVFDKVSLYLLTGQPELADATLRELEERLGPTFGLSPESGFREAGRRLKLQTALIIGRFSQAIALQEEMIGEMEQRNRKGWQPETALSFGLGLGRIVTGRAPMSLFDLMEVSYVPRLTHDLNQLAVEASQREQMFIIPPNFKGNPVHFPFVDRVVRNNYVQALTGLDNLRFELGMTYLEQGDVASARRQFEHHATSLPAEFRSDARLLSAIYLSMLNRR